MSEIIFQVNGMSKSFGPTKALRDVDFTLKRGEVHGLIGENGSGKSTLSSIIAGMQKADCGSMTYKGSSFSPKTVNDSLASGIAMIVQEMGTCSSIGVAENLFLGNEGRFKKGPFIDKKAMRAAGQEMLSHIGITNISAARPTGSYDPESRKLIEIAKAMSTDPEILIVDETTTALSQDGRSILYKCIEEMKNQDKAVILISHDLDEIMNVCNMLTVLRDGVIVGTLTKEEFDPDKIKSMMVGRELTGAYYRNDYDGSFEEEVVLKCDNVSGLNQVTNVNFELHKGEILGVGGLSNGGIHELGQLLFGIEKPILGKVCLSDGTELTDPTVSVKHKVGYVSKNRDVDALMLDASIKNNCVLPSLPLLTKACFITGGAEKKCTQNIIDTMEIKCSSMEQNVRSLSGGNKQKVSFGKWIGCGSKILILDCPTRGIDVGVKQAMYQMIYRLKKEGYSFVLISEELGELIGMSDRVMIMKDGRITGEYERSEDLSENDLIKVMI